MDVEKTIPARKPAAQDSVSAYTRCASASGIESSFACSSPSLQHVGQQREVGQPTHNAVPQLAGFDRAAARARAGQLTSAVDWAITSAVNDGAFTGIAAKVATNLCSKCDDTGYKDHAGFAMDPCDHG